jgi:hypothetical protein
LEAPPPSTDPRSEDELQLEKAIQVLKDARAAKKAA